MLVKSYLDANVHWVYADCQLRIFDKLNLCPSPFWLELEAVIIIIPNQIPSESQLSELSER